MGLKPDEITPDWSIWDYGSHWLVNNDAWGVEIPITKRKDAHLIAAAPKLLGAIKDFLAVLEGEVLARGYGMADSIEEAHPAELRALEAAIAKAEGERKPAKELTLAEARARLAQREAEIRASMDKPPEPKPTPDIDRS